MAFGFIFNMFSPLICIRNNNNKLSELRDDDDDVNRKCFSEEISSLWDFLMFLNKNKLTYFVHNHYFIHFTPEIMKESQILEQTRSSIRHMLWSKISHHKHSKFNQIMNISKNIENNVLNKHKSANNCASWMF